MLLALFVVYAIAMPDEREQMRPFLFWATDWALRAFIVGQKVRGVPLIRAECRERKLYALTTSISSAVENLVLRFRDRFV